ncbi:MAG: calcium-binding protein [Myxococcota bacterium]
MHLTPNPGRTRIWTLATALAFGTACGSGQLPQNTMHDPEFEGFDDLGVNGSALTDLSGQCDYASGFVTLTLQSGNIAVLSKTALGEVAVNGYPCGDATTTNTKNIAVVEDTGSTGAETLVIDYLPGMFATGRTSTVGIAVDLGTGSDSLRFRGTTGNDKWVLGQSGLAVNTDSNVDVTYANVEEVIFSLGPGNDTFSAAGGTGGAGAALTSSITIYGGSGNDTLRGGDGDDVIYGGEGNDTFTSGALADGADDIHGGAGTDVMDYSARTASVTVTIDGNADDGAVGETDNINTDVENLKGGHGDDSLTGSAQDNVIWGGPGADSISGGDGDDTLNGDAGDDTFLCGTSTDGADIFSGGAGIDTVDYSSRTATLTITINGTANDGEDGENDNVKTDVENVYGGSGPDDITGSSGNNILEGRAGNDTIHGGAGNDTIRGGAGNDTLYGDAGNDTFDEEDSSNGSDTMAGGIGTDTVDYSARTNDLTITLTSTNTDGETNEGDDVGSDVENVLCGDGDDDVTGSDSNNVIDGGAGNDTLSGGAGNDVISGGSGTDTIDGGEGDDEIDGDGGTDSIDCGAGDGDICADPADCASATACEL